MGAKNGELAVVGRGGGDDADAGVKGLLVGANRKQLWKIKKGGGEEDLARGRCKRGPSATEC